MTMRRRQLVDVAITRYYHCISRCVRRAFPCGESVTHRKAWVASIMTRLRTSAECWRSHLHKLLGKTRWLRSHCATSAERLKAIAGKRGVRCKEHTALRSGAWATAPGGADIIILPS